MTFIIKFLCQILDRLQKKWYNQDKEASVKSYKEARNLLNWIIDTVIGERHARAFLFTK